MILFFFEVIHILLIIVIMHYIFLVSFGTIKIFKFQNYYLNSHSLKEIIIVGTKERLYMGRGTLGPAIYLLMWVMDFPPRVVRWTRAVNLWISLLLPLGLPALSSDSLSFSPSLFLSSPFSIPTRSYLYLKVSGNSWLSGWEGPMWIWLSGCLGGSGGISWKWLGNLFLANWFARQNII